MSKKRDDVEKRRRSLFKKGGFWARPEFAWQFPKKTKNLSPFILFMHEIHFLDFKFNSLFII